MKQLGLTMGLAAAWMAGPAFGAVDFAKDIQPILKERCLGCHGPQKQKGKLRLDSKEAAFKQSDEPIIAPGHADQSELYRRITLPKGDDDLMPAEGEPLTKAQIELIKAWIEEGAPWPDGLVLQVAEAAPAKEEDVLPQDFKPGPAEAKAIATLAQSGVEVRPVAMNVPWTEANLRLLGSNVTDAVIAPLKDVTSLIDLNLATTKITDAGLAYLKDLPHLTKLHLELTGVTDAGLAHLAHLPRLRYLNLYGTQVTDAGLQHLKHLKSLRQLYVWQTQVTDAGLASLKEALPGLEIVKGWDAAALAKKEEPADAKPEEEKK